jgi:hypothetical protein
VFFESPCQKGKIIPLKGTNSLRKAKRKNQRRKNKMKKREEEAIKKLEEEFKKISPELQKKVNFYEDISDVDSYTWIFKVDKSIIKYSYIYETGKVEKRFA